MRRHGAPCRSVALLLTSVAVRVSATRRTSSPLDSMRFRRASKRFHREAIRSESIARRCGATLFRCDSWRLTSSRVFSLLLRFLAVQFPCDAVPSLAAHCSAVAARILSLPRQAVRRCSVASLFASLRVAAGLFPCAAALLLAGRFRAPPSRLQAMHIRAWPLRIVSGLFRR